LTSGDWALLGAGAALGLLYAGIRRPGSDTTGTSRRAGRRSGFFVGAALCIPYGFVLAPVLVLGVMLAAIFGACSMSLRARNAVEKGFVERMTLVAYVAVVVVGGWRSARKMMAWIFTPVDLVLRRADGTTPRQEYGP
jgi:hypothetical protein